MVVVGSSYEMEGPQNTSAWEQDANPDLVVMGKGSIAGQFKALIIRNITLKKRDKRKTVIEFVMPLYWILILAGLRAAIPDTIYPAVLDPHGESPVVDSLYKVNKTTLHVAPDTQKVKDLMDTVEDLASEANIGLYIEYYTSEDTLIQHFRQYGNMTVAVILSDDPLTNMTYTLRFNPLRSLVPSTTGKYSDGAQCRGNSSGLQLDCPSNNYFHSGFSGIQALIDTAFIRLSTTKDIALPYVLLQSMPRGEYQSDGGMVMRNIVPLYMVFAWAQFIVYMLILVVDEKEKKIKESMKMMGLRDTVYWLSWFVVYFGYVLILALICIAILPAAGVFGKADIFLLFMLFILYGCSSIMFSFMITPFFNKAKVAGIAGNLIQLLLSLLFYLQVYLGDEVDAGVFWALALLSPCAFSFALDKAIMFDYSPEGLTFNRVWDGPGLPFAGSLIMLSVDICLYLFLAYYLDNVVPSEYGTKKKPWFLFQKSFWVDQNKDFQFATLNSSHNKAFEADDEVPSHPDMEEVSAQLKGKVAVRIRNLVKVFKPRDKDPVRAVDGFSLDIYEGQITAILGHNGAGKTTLFNILTGMTSATHGSATIFGMDISDQNQLAELRRITGVCPQHDVVFLLLTPKEHLHFFARIRGVPEGEIEAVVEQTLKEVDLYSKQHTKASDLSGGQKRKLSIGIAIIGDPKIIFLDEPTAGVDAYSRRKLWSLLKNRKEGKVILLTTHFMDEADILSDRKAVMSQGKLRCCGSSLFLKNKFGIGYHLTLVVSETAEEGTITRSLQQIIPDTKLGRYYGKEMAFILPSDSAGQFTALFTQLDDYITGSEANIGIEGYGIAMTTLEEVFLALSEENEGGEMRSIANLGQQMITERSPSATPLHQPNGKQKTGKQNNGGVEAMTVDNSGFTIDAVEVKRDTWRAFKALLKFRALGFIREPVAVFFLIVLPLGFTIGAMALADGQSIPISTNKLLSISTDIYNYALASLLHNATTAPLTDLVGTLQEANINVSNYSGKYSELVQWGHISAFNVDKFPSLTVMDTTHMTLSFNDTFLHAIPILVNLVNNAIFSSLGGEGVNETINISSQYLPALVESVTFDFSSFFAPILIGFTFTMIPAAMTMDLVNDREIKVKSLLRLNGVGFNLYFSSYLIMMTVLYMITYVGLLIIIQAFRVKSLVLPGAFAAIAILYFLYLPCAMLFNATFSYMFEKAETARQFYPSMTTSVGSILYTVVSLLDMLLVSESNPALIIHIVASILFPAYIPFGLLYYINKIYIVCSITGTCNNLTSSDYMTTEIVIMFVMLVVDIPIFYLLLRVVDTRNLGGSWREALWMKKKKKEHSSESGSVDAPKGEDDDVVREREKVAATLAGPQSNSPVLIYDLGKSYKKDGDDDKRRNPCKRGEKEVFRALQSVSLEVKAGEVLGLLGPNGAGKTTCLRIMTAEESPDRGMIQLCGEDVLSSMAAVFDKMGYCPQHDSLWRKITVAEHIRVYAEVRGVRPDQVDKLIDMYMKGLEVEEHRNKKSQDCSGGTKRKLSYIMSMLGRPQLVLLDEPSTGMDPKSKRFLWNSILASFKGERSAILTTHSMEEADALCSNIGILVKGGMRCIGPIQHLKNKYGGGYSLEVKLRQHFTNVSLSNQHSNSPDGELENTKAKIQNTIRETFPNAVLDEEFGERLMYKVPQRDVTSLARCFQVLEEAKNSDLVEEYALSQTTLEQVFLQFARQQEEVEEEVEEEDGHVNGGVRLE